MPRFSRNIFEQAIASSLPRPSPTQPVKTSAVPPAMEPVRSPPRSPLDKPSGVRFSDRGLPTRSSAARTYSNVELSTIDQKWGRLFDGEGKPTKRLGQFLRGLANHIVGGLVLYLGAKAKVDTD